MSERHTHASAHGRPKWPVGAMVTCALLTAVSVVLARFLIPTPNEVPRFSLAAVLIIYYKQISEGCSGRCPGP